MKKHSQHKAIKITLVGPVPPPMGGMSMQTLHFYQALKREGHQVALIPSNARLQPKWLNEIKGVRAILRFSVLIYHLLKSLPKMQVVHVMSNSGLSWFLVSAPTLLLAHWFKVPVIVNYRGGNAQNFLKRYGFLVRISLKHAYKIIVPSEFLAYVFQEQGYDSFVIPNSVDTQRFKPHPHPTDECRCLIARNLERIYGIDTAIQALALVRVTHPQFCLAIAGEGAFKKELNNLVTKYKLHCHVHFLGRLSRVQMARQYAQADMLLNPSRVDNMPNALLEAQAAGVPIITSSVGGIPYMVKSNHTALFIEPNNVEALARAMIALYQDHTLRQTLIHNGIENSKKFTWEVVKAKWEQVYDQAS